MARQPRGGSSRRPTGSGARPSARRNTSRGRSPARTPTQRGRATRSGPSAQNKSGGSTLLVGGAILGGVGVLALLAVIAKGGGNSKGDEERDRSVSLADLAPKDNAPPVTWKAPPTRKPITTRRSEPVKPKHPRSYYLAMCDQKLWDQAKTSANGAQKLLADVRKGNLRGMSEKAAKAKVKEGFAMALELANEFLSPVESKYRKEARHFLSQYDDIMMSWQRNMRSVVFGRDR